MKHDLPLKLIMTTLLSACALLGCAGNSTQPNYDLDPYTLSRSAVFTQRELINEQLKDPASINTQVLLNSYCDLVTHTTIYVSSDNRPQQCQILSHKQRQCAKNYHICIRSCPLRSNDCQPCIERTRDCLAPQLEP